MPVDRSRALYALALALAVLAVALVLGAGIRWGGRTSVWVDDPAELGTVVDRPGMVVAGVVVAVLAVVPLLTALVGALVTAARAEQWVWFVLLLVLPGVTLLVYVVVRPAWAVRHRTVSPGRAGAA